MFGIALLSGSIVSCSSSDDFTSKLEIADKVATTGIEAEIDGLYTTIKIKSNDNWTIEVPADAQNWLDVPVDSGNGDMEVPISIDPNFDSLVGRKTTITIKTGTQEQKIEVKQTPTYKGQSVATNGVDGVQLAKLMSEKGVGMGYDEQLLDTVSKDLDKALRSQIFNMKAIDQLQKDNALEYGELFTFNKESAALADGEVKDSIESKKDSLGASLSFCLNYAKFQLKLGGSYHGQEGKVHYKDSYNYGASFKAATARIDALSAKAAYHEAIDEKLTGTEISLFTKGFKTAKKDVENAVNSGDENSINNAINELVTSYGTFVTTGCKLGGRIAMSLKFSKDSISDTLKIDTARIAAGYKSFLSAEQGGVEVHGGGEVSYHKLGSTILQNSAYQYNIAGGTKQAMDSLTFSLDIVRQQGDKTDVYKNVQNNIKNWVASINADDFSSVTAMQYTVYPIWSLFRGKTAERIQNWIQSNCTKSPLGLIKNKDVKTATTYDNKPNHKTTNQK